jgi:hypothetical protein
METINKFLIWISGYKSILAVILTSTNSYLWNKGCYQEIDFLFISVILGVLFGGAAYQTKIAFSKQNK